MSDTKTLVFTWSGIYHPAWDATPEAYLEAGLVAWGRSRRLARAATPAYAFTAYLGIHHNTWGENDTTRFFLSLLVGKRTIALRTFSTLPEALAELDAFHARLVAP